MAKFVDKVGLTFDDVCLVPVYNNVSSRSEPSLKTVMAGNDLTIEIPIINSPMSSVINAELAGKLWTHGTIPIFHRFYNNEIQLRNEIDSYLTKYNGGFFFISVGTKTVEELTLASMLYEDYRGKMIGICIDVANGHSSSVEDTIKKAKDYMSSIDVIAGSVCTARGTFDLIRAGADAIRVGIGPGSNCSTRMVTGFGSPQLTALMECAEEASRHGVPIISDGGIRGSRDIVLALAAGASSVMIGRLLAGTAESAAEKKQPMLTYMPCQALYKGQASASFQREGMIPEGVERWIPVTGSVDQLIDELMAGVRSGLTYGGARDILELQRKAVFMPVSSTYLQESSPRE